jgi:hypothetical protein
MGTLSVGDWQTTQTGAAPWWHIDLPTSHGSIPSNQLQLPLLPPCGQHTQYECCSGRNDTLTAASTSTAVLPGDPFADMPLIARTPPAETRGVAAGPTTAMLVDPLGQRP